MGQIVQKRIVKNRVVLGQVEQSVYTKQNCRGPTRQNQAKRIIWIREVDNENDEIFSPWK